MPVNQPELQKHTRMFTQQDFLDGKCTKEGFEIKKGEAVEPEQAPTEAVESSPVADETQPTEAVQPEASGAEPTQEAPKEGE